MFLSPIFISGPLTCVQRDSNDMFPNRESYLVNQSLERKLLEACNPHLPPNKHGEGVYAGFPPLLKLAGMCSTSVYVLIFGRAFLRTEAASETFSLNGKPCCQQTLRPILPS